MPSPMFTCMTCGVPTAGTRYSVPLHDAADTDVHVCYRCDLAISEYLRLQRGGEPTAPIPDEAVTP